jgi:hypothetical protein
LIWCTIVLIQNVVRRVSAIPGKPTEREDEYFARLEFERRRNVLDERATRPRAATTGETRFPDNGMATA